MRDGWTETTLGDVAGLVIGRTPSRSEKKYWTDELTNPFCTIADMDGKWISPSREGVTNAAIQEGKARLVSAGSLMMSFKLTLGRVGFAGVDLYPNEAIVAIDVEPSRGSSDYLYLVLGFQDLSHGSGRAIKGATLNSKSLAAIPLNLPPLPEQKRIVDVVSSVDAYIDALQQQADTARRARNAVLHELLSAGGDDWTETTLGDVADASWGNTSVTKKQYKDSGFTAFSASGPDG
jgi:type I restriction enzyme S subunit